METRGIVIEDGTVLRSKVQGCQENQPAQLSPPAVAPRAKEVAAVGGAQAKHQERDAGDFLIVALCAASSAATFPIMREPTQPRQDSRRAILGPATIQTYARQAHPPLRCVMPQAPTAPASLAEWRVMHLQRVLMCTEILTPKSSRTHYYLVV
jgi:hypothetical protein